MKPVCFQTYCGMRYYSTRDQKSDHSKSVDFEKALFSGYVDDGGLYVPRELPQLNWRQWNGLSYKEIVAQILKAFVDDNRISVDEIVESVYTPATFDHPDMVPIAKPYQTDDLFVMELFHGPTWSFKDYALQVIGRLLDSYLKLNGKHSVLLVVTTGDTGSAAIEAVRKCSNIDIIVMFPRGRISPTQERQMTSVMADNVHVYAGEGVCGDLDAVVRTIFADSDYVERHCLGSINSVNWARIMVQMAHWFYAYFRVMSTSDKIGEPLTVAVPTGAGGNLCGALYAKKMGLPLNIVSCTNKNDTVHKWIQTGLLKYTPVSDSLASAMDIDTPMNIERIIHLLAYENDSCSQNVGQIAAEMMTSFYDGGKTETPPTLVNKLKQAISSCTVSDSEIEKTINSVYAETGYLCCPHTATGIRYAHKNPAKRPIVCAATAAPYKFHETMTRLGIQPLHNQKLAKLQTVPVRSCGVLNTGENWIDIIKRKIEEISDRRSKG